MTNEKNNRNMTAADLKKLMERDEHVAVVNVLGKQQFDQAHIPNSRHADVAADDFVDRVEGFVGGDKKREVVVYCASTGCDASTKAARKLDRAGFARVREFDGGMQEWEEAGNMVAAGKGG